jgi:hypothetical protein
MYHVLLLNSELTGMFTPRARCYFSSYDGPLTISSLSINLRGSSNFQSFYLLASPVSNFYRTSPSTSNACVMKSSCESILSQRLQTDGIRRVISRYKSLTTSRSQHHRHLHHGRFEKKEVVFSVKSIRSDGFFDSSIPARAIICKILCWWTSAI